jgi:hypothetical protein
MSNNTENSAASSQAPEITLNDFANLVRIIDVASRRGAFEGKELSSVGSVRDKVEAFLVHYAPKQEQANASGGDTANQEDPQPDLVDGPADQ